MLVKNSKNDLWQDVSDLYHIHIFGLSDSLAGGWKHRLKKMSEMCVPQKQIQSVQAFLLSISNKKEKLGARQLAQLLTSSGISSSPTNFHQNCSIRGYNDHKWKSIHHHHSKDSITHLHSIWWECVKRYALRVPLHMGMRFDMKHNSLKNYI